MAFGLKNVLGTFQWAVDVLLTKGKYHFAIVHLDDIVKIFGMDDHIGHGRQVLMLLFGAGL